MPWKYQELQRNVESMKANGLRHDFMSIIVNENYRAEFDRFSLEKKLHDWWRSRIKSTDTNNLIIERNRAARLMSV